MGKLDHFRREVSDRLPLSQLVGRRVQLRRAGKNFTGLCPFHKEKTPSFSVVDEKGFYHCFGCGKSGDIIGWLVEGEGYPFPRALEELSKLTGVPVPASSASPAETQQQKARSQHLLEAHEYIARFSEQSLQRAPSALAYLAERGVSEETRHAFRLGYGAAELEPLRQFWTQQGIQPKDLIELGVLGETDGRFWPRFRNRLLFPIQDEKGRVVGFGGRMLDAPPLPAGQAPFSGQKAGGPKYLNTPQTPLFSKGELLYNLHRAVEALRLRPTPSRGGGGDGGGGNRTLLVVEGYMDVLTLHQMGIRTAVAPLGTALTEAQMRLLWRYCPAPILCFDGDAAGKRASFLALTRVLPLLSPPRRTLKFCSLPAGSDPDSLIRDEGKAKFVRRLASDSLASCYQRLWSAFLEEPQDDEEDQAVSEKKFFDLIRTIEDASLRGVYERSFRADIRDVRWQRLQEERRQKRQQAAQRTDPHGGGSGGSGGKKWSWRNAPLGASLWANPEDNDALGEALLGAYLLMGAPPEGDQGPGIAPGPPSGALSGGPSTGTRVRASSPGTPGTPGTTVDKALIQPPKTYMRHAIFIGLGLHVVELVERHLEAFMALPCPPVLEEKRQFLLWFIHEALPRSMDQTMGQAVTQAAGENASAGAPPFKVLYAHLSEMAETDENARAFLAWYDKEVRFLLQAAITSGASEKKAPSNQANQANQGGDNNATTEEALFLEMLSLFHRDMVSKEVAKPQSLDPQEEKRRLALRRELEGK